MGKHLCWRVSEGLQLYLKETQAQLFSCEYCEVFKNTYFEEHLRTAASEITNSHITKPNIKNNCSIKNQIFHLLPTNLPCVIKTILIKDWQEPEAIFYNWIFWVSYFPQFLNKNIFSEINIKFWHCLGKFSVCHIKYLALFFEIWNYILLSLLVMLGVFGPSLWWVRVSLQKRI